MSQTDNPKTGRPSPPPPAQVPDEELAYHDDAIIGRAFRWSGMAALLLLAIGAVVFLILNRQPPPPPVQMSDILPPVTRQTPVAEVPIARFTDITAQAGIDFVHVNGAAGEKLLPETMGGGVAFLDFNNNGHQDLLLVNSDHWPWDKDGETAPATLALYRNDGTGRFENVTAGSGLDVSLYGMAVAVGDYDNDGLVDVFITAVGENRLFRNLGDGKFEDVTARAGVAGDPNEWSTAAAWIDYNNNGLLDLFVCNYVRWSKEIDFEVAYSLVGIGRAYGPPMNFEGTFPYLYRNEGDGTFTDVSASSGIQMRNPATGVPMAKSLGIAPIDLDQDGWIDFIVANDTVQNFVFHNQRDGTFREIGALSGIAFDQYGLTRGAMGIDAGFFRNDNSLGIAIANFSNEMNALYVSQGAPLIFADEAIAEGIGPASRLLLKFGMFFFDYDLDGRLDVLTANGHIEDEINKVQATQQYAQPAQLFWNAGPNHPSSFVSVPPDKAGSDLFQPIVGRGSAFADIDGDGDLDVVLTQIGGPPLLLRNDQELGHNWIRLKLVGTKSNRDAIGAWVRLYRDDQVLSRQVMPTRSYLSQSELPVTFGLGEREEFDRIEITWPLGLVQEISPAEIPLNTLTTIVEPE